MANTLVQFRIEEDTKNKAIIICNQLGIDLQTYMRMCLSRLVSENGIPFSMKVQDVLENKGVLALREMQRTSVENGNANMTLDEINNEISKARTEAKSQKK